MLQINLQIGDQADNINTWDTHCIGLIKRRECFAYSELSFVHK